ncbi:adhesion G protein-coupled receptor E1-like [Carcharodon carcharias]|uniref:adhesion G protein-coupled receptor E1-like n=1 Tax=Carcharodon carcharias TaxID=13397 RepID=UPI001B7EA344|nr:adhesion G protein-coupled receptor E1-like [Carcharodon carcharias]
MRSLSWANLLVAVWIPHAVNTGGLTGLPSNLSEADTSTDYSGDDLAFAFIGVDDEDFRSTCGPHAQYHVANGSLRCTCEKGYIPTSGKIILSNKAGCRRNISKAFNDSESLDTFIHQLHQNDLSDLSVPEIVNFTEGIVDNPKWESLEPDTKHSVASKLLQTVSSSMMAAALNAPYGTLTASSKFLDLKIRVHRGNISENERLTLNVGDNKMELYWRTATGGSHSGVAAVGFIAYGNLESILDGDFVDEQNGKREKVGGDCKLISDVVTVTMGDGQRTELREPVNFTLRHKEEINSNKMPICVHWENAKERSFWSPISCKMVTFSGNHTTCGCLRLANFAILMAPIEIEDGFFFHIISFVGVSLSLICLGICIITFAFCRSIQQETRTIHLNLSLSLFLALLLFLTGISRTDNKIVCAIIAGFLFYLFLVAFAWMFLEGLYLFLIVRHLRKVKVSRMTVISNVHLYTIGYVLPAVVLGISAAINPSGFGTSRHCWLQLERGFIWSFLGPVCCIILINTALLVSILWILQKQLSGLNSKVSKIKDTRMLTFKALAQVFILGCTWILGLFHFRKETIVMAYLFTIINSFQGIFIFIILCVLNKQVRKEYRKCFGGIKKPSLWSESASTNVVTATLGEGSVVESKV